MIEVILDTETTGLSTAANHRIVEIGCIELNSQIPTNKIFLISFLTDFLVNLFFIMNLEIFFL